MSMPGLHHFINSASVWIGASWNTQVTWKEGNPLAPVNLTLWPTLNFVIKAPLSKTILLNLSIGSGIIVTNAAAGEMLISITDEQSALFKKDETYNYLLTASNGTDVRAILAGFIEFTDDPVQQ